MVGRCVLVVLAIWALAMVVPDLARLVHRLGSFGFFADSDGVVTDVQGPFNAEEDSPAWQAGLRVGDRLDLHEMRCVPLDTLRCATALAVMGALELVGNDRQGEIVVAANEGKPARQIDLVAKTRPFAWWAAFVLGLDQLAAIAAVLAAAWLVWTRPGKMTWGFFLFVIWFNPGQSFVYYALLQYSPAALLTQNLVGAIAQASGFVGFLLFALRAPQDHIAPRWRPIEKSLPGLFVAVAVLLAVNNANVFGYPTELVTRAGILVGLAVAAAALIILLGRRGEQPPADYQRLRWVIWGCLIGLPSLTLADLAQQTSIFAHLWGGSPPPEDVWNLLRLVNGVLCLFVFQAVRSPRVVSVAIPLRRVTILGILLSLPTLLLHEQIQHFGEWVQETFHLPAWAWLVAATFFVFVLSRMHELAVHHSNHFFNRAVAESARVMGKAISQAQNFATVEAQLVGEAAAALHLVSAALFRRDGDIFRRTSDWGWKEEDTQTFELDEPMRQILQARKPFDIAEAFAKHNGLPEGLARPVVAVPVANRFELYAFALYGPHITGADLDEDERATLVELGDHAGGVWTKLEHQRLREQIAALEWERDSMAMKLAATPSGFASGA
jgi:hypothetical protein